MRNHLIPAARAATIVIALALAACSQKREEQAIAPAPEPASATAHPPPAIAGAPTDEPECTNEPRTDENDKRPRCGGIGTTPPVAHAYRITLDSGESFTACDITKPFTGKIGRGMVTMAFTPADGRSGKVAWHFAGGGGMADTAYDYTLDGPEYKMTGTFRANAAVCGKAAGLGVCAAAKKQAFTSTWARTEDCGK
jgi:hypothetical protein